MINGTILQYFHWFSTYDDHLWWKLQQDAGYLAELGFTTVWLPPLFKATAGGYSVGYDAYDLYDLGEFDQKGSVRTKYGDRQELMKALEACKKNKLGIYLDMILNHKAGADETETATLLEVDANDRTHIIGEPFETEIFSKFTFHGRQGKYSDFIWDKHCFIGTDYDAGNQRSGIFVIQDGPGKWWEEDVSEELGNFDYLMYNDLDYRNQDVKEELKKWIGWLFDTVHFDGVRMDAMKHIAPYFTVEFLDHIRSVADKEIFAVGEYWSPGDAGELMHFIGKTENKMHLFDAPLQAKFHNASKQGRNFDLRTIFENTLTKVNPDKAVTFVANHDTQPLRHIESPVDPWFKPLAYALILLRREGYPCVFYPDLFGATYRDKGQDGNEHDVLMPRVDKIEELMAARKKYAYGEQYDYFDDPDCIAWVRSGLQDKPGNGCVVILSNGEPGNKRIQVGLQLKNVQFYDALGNVPDKVRIDTHGTGNFYCHGGSVSVWVKEESILIGGREIPVQEINDWVNVISKWGKKLFDWMKHRG